MDDEFIWCSWPFGNVRTCQVKKTIPSLIQMLPILENVYLFQMNKWAQNGLYFYAMSSCHKYLRWVHFLDRLLIRHQPKLVSFSARTTTMITQIGYKCVIFRTIKFYNFLLKKKQIHNSHLNIEWFSNGNRDVLKSTP